MRLRCEEEEDPADRWAGVAAREKRETAAASLGLLHAAGPKRELGRAGELAKPERKNGKLRSAGSWAERGGDDVFFLSFLFFSNPFLNQISKAFEIILNFGQNHLS